MSLERLKLHYLNMIPEHDEDQTSGIKMKSACAFLSSCAFLASCQENTIGNGRTKAVNTDVLETRLIQTRRKKEDK